jgi:hypothetical protein
VWLADALANARCCTLIEGILADGPRQRKNVLLELSGASELKRGSNHGYRVLNRLLWQRILRNQGDLVALRLPRAVRDALDALDRYAVSAAASHMEELTHALSRIESRQRPRHLEHDDLPDRRPPDIPVDEPPSVHWMAPTDPRCPPGGLLHTAAHYDAGSNALSINADWRHLKTLCETAYASAERRGYPLGRLPWLISEEWPIPLIDAVVGRRTQAREDGLEHHLVDYLSEDALTTVVSAHGPILEHVHRRVRQQAGRERRSPPRYQLAPPRHPWEPIPEDPTPHEAVRKWALEMWA